MWNLIEQDLIILLVLLVSKQVIFEENMLKKINFIKDKRDSIYILGLLKKKKNKFE